MSQQIYFPFVGSIIAFLFSIVILLFAGFFLYKMFKYTGNATGIIMSSDFYDTYVSNSSSMTFGKYIRTTNSNIKTRYNITVKFTVKNKEYITTALVTQKYNINDTIPVKYDPSNPSNSEIQTSSINVGFFLLAFGCLFLIISIASFISNFISD